MDLQTAQPLAPVRETHRMRFTGDGGVYFGVWLVNLLLTVVTLAIYTPFARRRTIKYFYAHTQVAGRPLEFVGGLRRMVFGFLMFFGWYIAYEIAINTEQRVATWLLGGFWIVVSPWLWASAVRFRVQSTRWRGIQGRFAANWGEAYAANWPMLVLAAAGGSIAFLVGAKPAPLPGVAGGIAITVAILYALVRLDYNYTCVRLRRTSFAGLSNTWLPHFGDFLRFTAAAFGIFLAVMAATGGIVALAIYGARQTGVLGSVRPGDVGFVILMMAIFFATFLGMYLSFGPALAYREARKFSLVWNHVALGEVAHFRSDLDTWAFVRLRLRNMFMTLLTMGFWRPFAVTNEYQRKLESVTLHVEGSLDELVGQYQNPNGAFGDAIADAVGFDAVG